MNEKRLLIKLGSQCNWQCPHCHNEEVNYPYNEKLIDFIKKNNYKRITFSGGEPLLYWKTIVKICEALGHDYQYRIITNGSLVDRAKVAFMAKYKISLIVSFDGSDGQRTENPPPNWRMISALKDVSFSTCVYQKNMNLPKIQEELINFCKKYKIRPKLSLQPEFIHQTSVVHQDDTTLETAKEYCRQIAKIIEPEIVSLVEVKEDNARFARMMQYHTLRKALAKWFIPKDTTKGIRCFNENINCVSLDGRFLFCPYNDKRIVGDIEKGIDWDKIQSMRPEKCLKCDIFNICRCSCLANVTENECYIAKTMNRWLNKVTEKYQCKDLLIDLWRRVNDYSFSPTPISK